MAERISINVSRINLLLGTLALLGTMAGTVWGATKAAVRHQVNQEVQVQVGGQIEGVRAWIKELKLASDIEHGTFARRESVSNLQSLIEQRLTTLEKRQDEMAEQVQYLYRREVERNRGGG